jgi:hypothetical protein
MADPKKSPGDVEQAAETLKATKTGLVLTGRITNGKLQLDDSTKKEIAEKYADADISFIALNAPYDPVSQSLAHA